MLKTIAHILIAFIMLFEVITVTSGAALYPVFAAAFGIIMGCIVVNIIIIRIKGLEGRHIRKRASKMVLLG